MKKFSIIIADDHPIFRQGLRFAFEREPDIQVAAEASDGREALNLIENVQPQVAILDVDMPQMSGFDVLRQTRKLKNPPEIIFLTVHRETDLLDEALSLGAKGYVLKDGAVTDIVASVRAVVRGDFYTSPAMTSHLVKRNRRPSAASGLAALTATERQVLRLLADYKTSKEIAAELSVSPRTVETHRANIAAKLNLHGSHALMRFALAHKSEL